MYECRKVIPANLRKERSLVEYTTLMYYDYNVYMAL